MKKIGTYEVITISVITVGNPCDTSLDAEWSLDKTPSRIETRTVYRDAKGYFIRVLGHKLYGVERGKTFCFLQWLSQIVSENEILSKPVTKPPKPGMLGRLEACGYTLN